MMFGMFHECNKKFEDVDIFYMLKLLFWQFHEIPKNIKCGAKKNDEVDQKGATKSAIFSKSKLKTA